MTNEEFRQWIEGYRVLTSDDFLDKKQLNIISNHARLVEATVGELDAVNSRFLLGLQEKMRDRDTLCISELVPG